MKARKIIGLVVFGWLAICALADLSSVGETPEYRQQQPSRVYCERMAAQEMCKVDGADVY